MQGVQSHPATDTTGDSSDEIDDAISRLEENALSSDSDGDEEARKNDHSPLAQSD